MRRDAAARAVVIMAEGGLQPAMGNGLVIGVDVLRDVAVDVGVGWSGLGPKSGVRLRLHLARGAVRPFVGAGLAWGLGRCFEDRADEGTVARIRLDPAASGQAQAGVHVRHRRGISLLAAAGYSVAWGGSPPQVNRGTVSVPRFAALDRLRGVGPVATLALGYAF